jgi:alkyl hydroperoxide reductase subunit AhpF
VPGIFAAGDARQGSDKQVASATGKGAGAALLVREYLTTVWAITPRSSSIFDCLRAA